MPEQVRDSLGLFFKQKGHAISETKASSNLYASLLFLHEVTVVIIILDLLLATHVAS